MRNKHPFTKLSNAQHLTFIPTAQKILGCSNVYGENCKFYVFSVVCVLKLVKCKYNVYTVYIHYKTVQQI